MFLRRGLYRFAWYDMMVLMMMLWQATSSSNEKVRLVGAAAQICWTPGSAQSVAVLRERNPSSAGDQAEVSQGEHPLGTCPAPDEDIGAGVGAGANGEVVGNAPMGTSPAPAAPKPVDRDMSAEVAGVGTSKTKSGDHPSRSPDSVPYSIPKLKISLKPPSPRPAQGPAAEVTVNEESSVAGKRADGKATSRSDSSTGGPSAASLKLVLKAPSISAATGSPRSGAGAAAAARASGSGEDGGDRGVKRKDAAHDEDSSSDEDVGGGKGRGSREVPAWLKAGSAGEKAKKNTISLSLSSPKSGKQASAREWWIKEWNPMPLHRAFRVQYSTGHDT